MICWGLQLPNWWFSGATRVWPPASATGEVEREGWKEGWRLDTNVPGIISLNKCFFLPVSRNEASFTCRCCYCCSTLPFRAFISATLDSSFSSFAAPKKCLQPVPLLWNHSSISDRYGLIWWKRWVKRVWNLLTTASMPTLEEREWSLSRFEPQFQAKKAISEAWWTSQNTLREQSPQMISHSAAGRRMICACSSSQPADERNSYMTACSSSPLAPNLCVAILLQT